RLKSLKSTPVTLSLNVTVYETLLAFVGLALAVLMDETVGAVTSYVTVLSVDVDTVLVLPAGSDTTPTAIVAVTVPVPVMPLMATVNVVPLFGAISVIAADFVPPAVPPIVTSEFIKL